MSTNKFPEFARVVAASFQRMIKSPQVFVVDIDGDALYRGYLAAFPEGTNQIFKKVSEHDCSCCRHFIRRAGAVITLEEDGRVHTIWGDAAQRAPTFYADVALELHEAVAAAGIRDIFRVGRSESQFGAQTSRSMDPETGRAITWDHFYTGEIPLSLRTDQADTMRGDYRTTVQVFERGLLELRPEAVDTVLGIIQANNLYRGEEHRAAIKGFQKLQREFLTKNPRERHLFVWANANSPGARFRNTVIGTLVQDLSEGMDLESAVRSFETKVAPQNYKRTTALITPMMVKKAMETIESLGLESALERRFAVIGDISVNDVKWVDGSVKPLMKGGVGDLLMKHALATGRTSAKDPDRAEDIAIDDFMTRVLPETQSMEILFKNEHAGNLMSLTAPVHPEPRQLFRWTNDFAWSYGGNVTDSIKERVKKAGGRVTGTLRVSLSWFNYDDLDLHIQQPRGRGVEGGDIYFGAKRGWTGGILDVDMNAGGGTTREPVENIIWPDKVPDGAYKVVVNNYAYREASNPGFIIEIECGGKVSHFSYNKVVRDRQDIHCCTLHMEDNGISQIDPGDPGVTASTLSQEKWGLKTETYVKVNAVTLSPNYWGENAVGNRHTFFVIEGAKSDEDTRGFYNEFLHPRLEQHRKVFEVIADKTKCRPTEGQLSGLGFSSTKKETFLVRVHQGKKQRLFNVHVGT